MGSPGLASLCSLSHWLAGLQSFHAHWFRSWWSGFWNHVFTAGTGHRRAPTASVLRAELGFGPAHCCVYRAKNCAWPIQKCLLDKWRKQQMNIEEEAGALKPPSKVIWNKSRPLHRPFRVNTNRVSLVAKRHRLLGKRRANLGSRSGSMPCFGSRVYVCLHPHPFRSSISKIITLHTDLHAIIIAWVLLRWGTSPPGPLTVREWQVPSQGSTDSWTSLLSCSRGREQRMKDSENKGKRLTAEGQLKDAWGGSQYGSV